MWFWYLGDTILLAHRMDMIYITLTLWLDRREYGNFTMIQNMNGLLVKIKKITIFVCPNKKCFDANSFVAKALDYTFMEHNAKSFIKPENAIL